MNPEDWIAAGYRRFELHSEFNKRADFGLQKRFDDEKGKKYFITVYVYDNKTLPMWNEIKQHTKEYGFMPNVQFRIGNDDPFFDITIGGTFDIARCESEIERLWVHFGCPYYEEWVHA